MRRLRLALVALAIAATAPACGGAPASVTPPPASPAAAESAGPCSLRINPVAIGSNQGSGVAGTGFTPDADVELTWLRDDGDVLVLRAVEYHFLKVDKAGTWGYFTRPLATSVGHSFTVTATDGACTARAAWQVRTEPVSVAVPAAGSPPPCSARATVDRLDQLTGSLVHLMYVVPADANDEGWDQDGTIARSAVLANDWLAAHAGGRKFRIDTCDGAADVTFVRLDGPDADYFAVHENIRDYIESELEGLGILDRRKIYGVYYGGRSTLCGGNAAWPPALPGRVGVAYHLGGAPGELCDTDDPGGRIPSDPEIVIVHELLHVLGFAPTCGKNNTGDGHVTDDPFDLMYQGLGRRSPSHLDEQHDDYFDHGIRGCPDLAHSTFIEPVPADAEPPPGWPGA